ncbi:hypothetical protein acsn021_32030 [Anaerocolumna cellulosilytica]|uniref:LiaI-LiaF-like transmembrane region domain-containing protein n=1 Tax=Anaerocolumna cellulosilytica TaxID=433286 RepID=A0A6S6QYC6_9FIRM|nr:DUF5668 domain-containing protein [Anaerocolumna cellulosilytica]MBB5196533.1 hypothetical protein [Anaerocolumna cellulosilytica]BCJ95634.1 hypothetical protein acsn021_32030 [Anaerocolumna cellulosilytica]
MRTHRVGTITLGTGLILFGILFFLRIITPIITYDLIFKIWPVLFILLGSEILISNSRNKEEILIYDKTAIFLVVLLTLFAMAMAAMQWLYEYSIVHYR